jgi:indolepyruvate ferredoxin oxidoreductase, beta subunit
MRFNLVLSGVGGQGIIFAARLLAQMALERDWPVIGAETHGMAQRGGSVVAHLRFGGAKGSLVGAGSAEALITFRAEEGYRNLGLVKSGGHVFFNTPDPSVRPEAAEYLDQQQITPHFIDADKLALDHNLPRAANLIMVGFACGTGALPFGARNLEETVRAVSPERFIEDNLKAISLGRN